MPWLMRVWADENKIVSAVFPKGLLAETTVILMQGAEISEIG